MAGVPLRGMVRKHVFECVSTGAGLRRDGAVTC
jgi:hypothetical protein